MLDTHTLIWWSEGDRRLTEGVRRLFADPDTSLLLSAVSIYEMRLKANLGKLASAGKLLANLEPYLAEQAIQPLPLEWRHADRAGRLPLSHRDPFDRMLVAQAMVEDLTIVSNDPVFDQFGISRLW